MNLTCARVAGTLPMLQAIRASATLLIGLLFVSLPAQSAMYFIDQSNALPDGVNYLRVDIENAVFMADANAIKFTVTLLPPLTSIADTNFGIQEFGFNSLLGVTSTDIAGLPAGWTSSDNMNMDGFGDFGLFLAGPGNRQDPTLEFFITGVIGDTPETYATLSGGTAGEGNQYFAAHVAGFDFDTGGTNGSSSVTSAFFGGQTLVPLPASLWLFVSALGGLGLSRRLFRRRSGTPPS